MEQPAPTDHRARRRPRRPTDPIGDGLHARHRLAARLEAEGIAKAGLGIVPLITLGVLGGVFFGFGAAFWVAVTANAAGLSTGGAGLTGAGLTGTGLVIGGIAFSLGLVLVRIGGAELFTGNALMVMAWADNRIGHAALLRNWSVVLAANFTGALGLVAMFWVAGLLDGAPGARVAEVADAKLALPPGQAFWRAVLGNALVCLAVWLSLGARSVSGKVMAIVWPVSAFAALGLEHAVANFYLIPAGLLAGAAGDFGDVLGNLVPVILGNVVGGAGGVAVAYRLAYGRPVTETEG